jgi:SpoVK/Ycf46/Vps4 family AAA+-type ATPase
VLSSTNARNPRFWNALFLPVTIGLLGTTLGVVPLHCACLDRNRSGLLVAGEAGAGKSTLTAALAKQGFGVVSDDWTYISKDGEELIAHGLFAPVKLLPDTIRFFPELQNFAPKRTLNGEMAHEIDPVSVFRSVTKAHSSPKWMLFLQRKAESGCRFGRCSPEYITNFFERNAEKLPPELQHASHARSEIIQSLSRCTSWILETGDGPIQTATAIDEFLLEV